MLRRTLQAIGRAVRSLTGRPAYNEPLNLVFASTPESPRITARSSWNDIPALLKASDGYVKRSQYAGPYPPAVPRAKTPALPSRIATRAELAQVRRDADAAQVSRDAAEARCRSDYGFFPGVLAGTALVTSGESRPYDCPLLASPSFEAGGGSFGGAGASSTWEAPSQSYESAPCSDYSSSSSSDCSSSSSTD